MYTPALVLDGDPISIEEFLNNLEEAAQRLKILEQEEKEQQKQQEKQSD